jgi:hypothetical protein
MIIVSHQHPSVDPPSGLGASLTQGSQHRLSILIIHEDTFSAITPCHDMVKRSGILNANLPGHCFPSLDKPAPVSKFVD